MFNKIIGYFDKDTLSKILNITKLLKTEVICIEGNTIMGSDINMCHLKTLEYEHGNTVNICFIQNELSAFLKTIEDNEQIIWKTNKLYVDDNRYIYINNDIFLNGFYHLKYSVLSYKYSIQPIDYGSVKENENFLQCMALKAAQGMAFFKLDKYIMSLFGSIFPVNKKDDVLLKIYETSDNTFLSNFTIVKGKNIINAYYNYIYLQN